MSQLIIRLSPNGFWFHKFYIFLNGYSDWRNWRMEQVALTEREKDRGRKLLDILYSNSPTFSRMDIDKMDVAEAKRIWRTLEPYRPIVASRASGKKRDTKHIDVLNLMREIQDKAEGGNVNGK